MKTIDYCEIRLVKYSRLIDRAILEKRYALSTQLAYRCLLEYNRLFMRYYLPTSSSLRKNAFQMSIEVVKHVRFNRRFFKIRKSTYLMRLLSTSYYLTNLSKLRYGQRDLHVDLATAQYARDQSLAISRFLMGTVVEDSERNISPRGTE